MSFDMMITYTCSLKII